MNGAQALLKALVDAGVDTCFANPGTSEMQLVYEMGCSSDVRPILCLQENTVTGAADGYARMAQKPAMTLLHVGSGFANGIANLHNAGRANTMMINIVGANATYHQPNFPEHELINGKVIDLTRPVSHWTREARSASDLAVLGAEAAQYAQSGAGKICSIVAPTNCHWDPAVAPPTPPAPLESLHVARETIDEMAKLLTNGKKTGIVVGSRAFYGEALELAGRIAAKTGADLLGETFPPRMSLGEGSMPVRRIPYFAESALKFLEPYDQLILVGAQLPVMIFAYQHMPVLKPRPDCHVTTLATVDHNMLKALDNLATVLNAHSQPVARQPRTASTPPTGELTDEAIGQSLAHLLPENAIVVDEATTMAQAIFKRVQGARAHDYLLADCGCAIGGGLPIALGAAIACPNRKVVALQADGCSMYTLQALWSMAREQADVAAIVLRNDNYAILEIELARVREGDSNKKIELMMSLTNPTLDWVKLAEGHGVSASSATTAQEFHQQLEKALATKGPRLIEARVSQNLKPMIDLIRGSR